ncbi:DUF4157 domain-containing protein [Nocardioides sp. 1609]|uniref:eCIS core domain-containing protein n=1 Tax=Nocardioides sp. 1609 TaxID=2508327 RepID=UPI001430D754|nr:DUF4157 domain-containing protein [Nocardioides sp. 1609]
MTDELAHARRTDDVDVPAPAPAPVVEGPAAPALVVGHAEDHAEADADRRADQALARLTRSAVGADGATEVDTHQHGPGCDHVRRSASLPPAGAAVGHEGGAVPTDAADRIERLRGSGQALPATTRSQMEGAFGASFSGVRIHTGPEASRLNRLVSARAFTTGRDVFFGEGEFQPDSREGQRTLAHELAHTLQGGSGVHRLGFLERAKLATGLGSDQERSTWEAEADQERRRKEAAAEQRRVQKEHDKLIEEQNAVALKEHERRMAVEKQRKAQEVKQQKLAKAAAAKKLKADAATTKVAEDAQVPALAAERVAGVAGRAAAVEAVKGDATARGPKDRPVEVTNTETGAVVRTTTGDGAKVAGKEERDRYHLLAEALADEKRRIAEAVAAGIVLTAEDRMRIFDEVWQTPRYAPVVSGKPTRTTADERQLRANNQMMVQEEGDALGEHAESHRRVQAAVVKLNKPTDGTAPVALEDIDVDQLRLDDHAAHAIAPPTRRRAGAVAPDPGETEDVVVETSGAVHEAGIEPATAGLGLAGAVKDYRVNNAPAAPAAPAKAAGSGAAPVSAPESSPDLVPDAGGASGTGPDVAKEPGAVLGTDVGTDAAKETGKDAAKETGKETGKDGPEEEDYVSKETEVAEAMGLVKDAVAAVYEIIDAGRRVYYAHKNADSGEPGARLEFAKASGAAVQTATSVAKTSASVAAAITPSLAKAVGKVVPGFNIAIAVESLIAAGFELKETIGSRSTATEALLQARADSAGKEVSSMVGTLVHVVDAVDLRLSRAVADAAGAVLSVISSIGSVVALPVAAILEAGNSVASIAAKIAHLIADEIRARAAQTANNDSALALEGAAREKLRKDPKTAARSLVQNARSGNDQARAVLKSCGISAQHLQSMTVRDLETQILKTFNESGDPLTLVQKIEALGDKISAYLSKDDDAVAPARGGIGAASVRVLPPPLPTAAGAATP